MRNQKNTRKRPVRRNQQRQVKRRTQYSVRSTGRHSYGKKKRKLNKKKVALVAIIFLAMTYLIIKVLKPNETIETSSEDNNTQVSVANKTSEMQKQEEQTREEPKTKKEITDWRLTLANYENILPEDFKIEVADIDDTRQFDARAIDDLKKMMNHMRKDGISNIWVQSAYRSIARQKELYDNSVKKYIKQGKTQEEAEKLTDEYINKPGSSDHNLGLAVDFNNVDNNFEDLKGFKWLQENAEDYGFILRYPKHKEDITKISYESWHWRYVGKEHAKKMNELDMCLEEYIKYLQNTDSEENINITE